MGTLFSRVRIAGFPFICFDSLKRLLDTIRVVAMDTWTLPLEVPELLRCRCPEFRLEKRSGVSVRKGVTDRLEFLKGVPLRMGVGLREEFPICRVGVGFLLSSGFLGVGFRTGVEVRVGGTFLVGVGVRLLFRTGVGVRLLFLTGVPLRELFTGVRPTDDREAERMGVDVQPGGGGSGIAAA